MIMDPLAPDRKYWTNYWKRIEVKYKCHWSLYGVLNQNNIQLQICLELKGNNMYIIDTWSFRTRTKARYMLPKHRCALMFWK